MTFTSRVLQRALRSMLAEEPLRTPAELAHLAKPGTDEARRVLRLLPVLGVLPLEPSQREFLPLVKRGLEELALDCEAAGDVGVSARAQVVLLVARLRDALA